MVVKRIGLIWVKAHQKLHIFQNFVLPKHSKYLLRATYIQVPYYISHLSFTKYNHFVTMVN
jgi:hypothetical protein